MSNPKSPTLPSLRRGEDAKASLAVQLVKVSQEHLPFFGFYTAYGRSCVCLLSLTLPKTNKQLGMDVLPALVGASMICLQHSCRGSHKMASFLPGKQWADSWVLDSKPGYSLLLLNAKSSLLSTYQNIIFHLLILFGLRNKVSLGGWTLTVRRGGKHL